MTKIAFEFFSKPGASPVTVVASDLTEAQQLYQTWLECAVETETLLPPAIDVFASDWLERRPLLREACSHNRSGIAYWSENRFGWEVFPADQKSALASAPPEGTMRCIQFTADEGDDALVFAPDHQEAVNTFCVWHIERWGSPPTHFRANDLSRWKLRGEMAVLRDQLEAEIEGVAHWDFHEGWQILPPELA